MFLPSLCLTVIAIELLDLFLQEGLMAIPEAAPLTRDTEIHQAPGRDAMSMVVTVADSTRIHTILKVGLVTGVTTEGDPETLLHQREGRGNGKREKVQMYSFLRYDSPFG